MKFQIAQKSLHGLEVLEIKNTHNGEYVNVIPNYGGAINEVVLSKEGKLFEIHKSAKSLKAFEDESIPLFSGAFLAPFPNRIKNGRYRFNDVDYQLDLTDLGLPNALHGFLYKLPFSIFSTDENLGEIILELHFNGEKGYPFKLYFKNTFKLSEGNLKITSFVRNDSDRVLPLGIGWHPNISTGTPIDLMELQIPGKKTFKQDSKYIPTGEIEEKTEFQKRKVISSEFMNDCYQFEQGNQTLIYDPINELEINIEQQVGKNAYEYCMYYTPPGRDCIAVEPMTAAPDAFNNGNGVLIIDKKETITLEFSIGLNAKPQI